MKRSIYLIVSARMAQASKVKQSSRKDNSFHLRSSPVETRVSSPAELIFPRNSIYSYVAEKIFICRNS
jgi:hypothetical protein